MVAIFLEWQLQLTRAHVWLWNHRNDLPLFPYFFELGCSLLRDMTGLRSHLVRQEHLSPGSELFSCTWLLTGTAHALGTSFGV